MNPSHAPQTQLVIDMAQARPDERFYMDMRVYRVVATDGAKVKSSKMATRKVGAREV